MYNDIGMTHYNRKVLESNIKIIPLYKLIS